MLYYIRYNVEHKHGVSHLQWHVFETENKFYETRNVVFKKPTWTGPTLHPSGDLKFSIYCDGVMTTNTPELIVIE